MKEIILATGNTGKINELKQLLAPMVCIPQTQLGIPDAEETGLSFIENALLKARHASQLSQKPALADDSGLVVHVLNGKPGIYSARFAGPNATDAENIAQLLQQLESTPPSQRQAYFYCAIALVRHTDDPTPLVATGQLHGLISQTPAGHHGFGYDPVFYLPNHQCTLAELSAELKNSLSHRAQALRQLCSMLKQNITI